MDRSYYPGASAHTEPRRDSVNSSATYFSSSAASPQKSLKASHVQHTSPKSTLSQHASANHKPPPARVHFDLHMSAHRDSCPDTKSTSMTESGLWTLPGFDDEETKSEATSSQPQHQPENRWARMLQSAASSNRQRHRARLEREGWAFIGGRYSDDMHALSDESGESVDEEFDVVVLPRECVGC
ncbi:Tripeptidyl-peptidase I [Ascochyta rabiei]|uniref:Serine-type endopeptidase n=1 Tax=Didymella rabiei TaxID=5454 RepID=A0A162XJP2_DIDRA|nr:Tripeptidyl-peptidase I [Ascochyta rabiei]KZM19584.1 serine-type endopeptidase [Ascochyta rabiei]UPX13558.1 Tripeptidyl-peptidase I [Ascochyta rabiei]